MRTRKGLLLLSLLLGIVGFADHPRAAGPTATFHIIGDLPGGGALTTVLNATRVGSGIYATGGLVTRLCPSGCPLPTGTDTNFLWRYDGTNATLEALPDIDANTFVGPLPNVFGITPDGRYIASTARIAVASNFETRAVRVDTTALPSTAANLNLNTVSSPDLVGPTSGFFISSDGTIVYGVGFGRGIRFDTTGATNLFIPLLCPAVSAQCSVADTTNNVRGASADANVAVGASFSNVNNHKAFRYVLGSGVTAIPFLPGGTFNDPLTLSPDGDLVLVVGNGTGAPNGEPYLYRASTGQIERLGSPNPNLLMAWGPGGRICANSTGTCNPRAIVGGMSADGSVVAMNFGSPSVFGGQYAYFHNEHGWFHLTSALLANGIDLGTGGWDPETLFIRGVSSDGTLVFGAGAQNGVVKGFVADFPAGALASFNPTPSPPVAPSIVGAWRVPAEPDQTVVFTADGAYYHIGRMESGGFVTTGFERGHYTYNGSVFTVTTLFDTNGKEGFSEGNGSTFPVAVTGNTFTFLDDPEGPDLERLVGGPGSIVGGWVQGNPAQRDSSFVIVFFDTGQVFQATDNPEFGGPEAGHGTYTWGPNVTCAPFTHELNLFPLPGDGGSPDLHNCGTLSSNELEIDGLDDDGHSEFHSARVIDPRTPLITSALNAVATTGLPFSYQITATNSPTTFGAIGLPPWLDFDIDTGVISGTPPAVTTVDIRIEASNALSTSTGRNHLSLVVIAPALVSEGPTTVTPIPPEEPGGTPPVTIEFENVTNGGQISVVSIDPADPSSPEPPSGFSLGDDPVYFEILPSEELTFTGPVTVCFSYEGITFSGFPRLLHYDEALMTWVDITTSVDTEMQIICGLTSSFSPFVIVATALNGIGFHPPIKPVAGELNTVKGGATVVLKFNVFSAPGVEVTDPNDIDAEFEVSPVECEGGAPSTSDVITITGNTGLRYDRSSHLFVQNWKTPKDPGCYLVQLKGEGLLLSALFKVR